MKLILSFCTILFLWLQAPADAQVRVLNDAVEFNGKVNTTQRKSLILQNESDQSKEYILKFLRGNIASSQNVKICLGNTCYDPKKDRARVKVKLKPGEIFTDLYLEFDLGISKAKGTFDLHFANTENLRDVFIIESISKVESVGNDNTTVDHKDITMGSIYPSPSNRFAQLDYQIKNPSVHARVVINSFIGNPVVD